MHYVIGVIVPNDIQERNAIEKRVVNLMTPYDESLEVEPYKEYVQGEDLDSMREYYSAKAWLDSMSHEEKEKILNEIDAEVNMEYIKENISQLDKENKILPTPQVDIDENDRLHIAWGGNKQYTYSDEEMAELKKEAVVKLIKDFLRELQYDPVTRLKRGHKEALNFIEEHGGKIYTDEELIYHMEDWMGKPGYMDEDGIYYWSTWNTEGKWDWYQIGGRWQGLFGASDPRDNPNNYEICDLCGGSGIRNDVVAQQLRQEDPNYKCNGCSGKGKRLKWATDWEDDGGNIVTLEKAKNIMENDDSIGLFGLITPKGEWISKGWDYAEFNDKKAPDMDDYPANEEGTEEYRKDSQEFREKQDKKWRKFMFEVLNKYPDDYQLVVVDYHC